MNDFRNNNGFRIPDGNEWNYSPYGGINYQYRTALMHRENEKKSIKKLSFKTGLALILIQILSFAAIMFLRMFGLSEMYNNDLLFSNAFTIMISLVCIFVPFFLISLSHDDGQKQRIFDFRAPKTTKLFITAVFAAFMLCLVANNISFFFSTLLEQVGFNSQTPQFPTPTQGLPVFFYFLSVAVVPAFVEEFALRGVVMQPLRKYGDWFAILVSAAVFALMHGNATQSFFAFLVGVVIGYFVIATNSIWTGVAIHFANNLFSVVFSVAAERSPDVTASIFNYIIAFLTLLGIVALIIFSLDKKRNKPAQVKTMLNNGQKLTSYVFTAPMVISLLILFFSIVTYMVGV
ncbi:MAG TPA: type II CAAX endopeptidase family protein [Clostridia bacterium]|nr:type II CAAX endopeptidase family protein [Clostridia bacterium]